MLPVAQIDPRAVDAIAGGGTRGLLTALVLTVVGLASLVVWLGKRALTRESEHAATLAALNTAHSAAIVAAHTQATAAVSAAVESATAAATASLETARSLAMATDNVSEVARVLERWVDRDETPRRRSK